MLREEYGEPDVIEVRQVFNDSLQAREWEEKVLRRMKVVKSEHWLNKTDLRSFSPKYGFENHNYGKDFSGQNNSMFGKHHSKESKQKIGYAAKGRIPHNKGKPHSEETKQKISKSKKK